MNYMLTNIMEFPQFKHYFLPSDQGQPIETAFEQGARSFLVYDEEAEDWAILQVYESLNGRWRPFFEGQAYALERHAGLRSLLPVVETGLDDGMIYRIRPYTQSESLTSFSRRVGALPWHAGAPMVRELVKTFLSLRDEEALFRRLDLSTVRVAQDEEGQLGLELISCSRKQGSEKSELERVRELCVLMMKLVDMGSAPDCVDRLIDLAYGLDQGDSPQNLNALLEALPVSRGAMGWWQRRSTTSAEWAPRSPFQHPDLKAFCEHFGPSAPSSSRVVAERVSDWRRRTASMPYTATSICLFAVGMTTSVWR